MINAQPWSKVVQEIGTAGPKSPELTSKVKAVRPAAAASVHCLFQLIMTCMETFLSSEDMRVHVAQVCACVAHWIGVGFGESIIGRFLLIADECLLLHG